MWCTSGIPDKAGTEGLRDLGPPQLTCAPLLHSFTFFTASLLKGLQLTKHGSRSTLYDCMLTTSLILGTIAALADVAGGLVLVRARGVER